MSKSALSKAAYEGEMDELRSLIEAGADLEGEDGEKWFGDSEGMVNGAPYYRPLSEAARNGQIEALKALLAAGAKIDAVNYRNETALALAAVSDEEAIVEALLEAGADVRGAVTCMIQMGGGQSTSILGRLLAAGARVEDGDVGLLIRQIPSRGKLAGYDLQRVETLRFLEPRLETGRERVTELLEKIDARLGKARKAAAANVKRFEELGSEAAVQKPGWDKEVKKLIGPLPENRAALEGLCKHTLSTAAAIAHPRWPDLVKAVVDRSQSYGDVTKAMYGKRLKLSQMEDDEGGAMDSYADEHLHTFDHVLRLLAAKEAVAHPKWAPLVQYVCNEKAAKVAYWSFGDSEIAELLALPHVKAHPAYAKVVESARKAFPYASCFGANGSLRRSKG